MKEVWIKVGEQIEKQLCQGKGIMIQKLGLFTLSCPEFSMVGTTNPEERDKQIRVPVFLISKEFIKGRHIKHGIMTQQGMRAYNGEGNTKM